MATYQREGVIPCAGEAKSRDGKETSAGGSKKRRKWGRKREPWRPVLTKGMSHEHTHTEKIREKA